MNIILQAKQVYKDMGYPDSFEYDLSDYLHMGYVIRTPEFFVLGKSVNLLADEEPHEQWNVKDPNAWYIKLLVGSLRALMQMVPFELPKVCFERWVRGKRNLKILNYNRVKELA